MPHAEALPFLTTWTAELPNCTSVVCEISNTVLQDTKHKHWVQVQRAQIKHIECHNLTSPYDACVFITQNTKHSTLASQHVCDKLCDDQFNRTCKLTEMSKDSEPIPKTVMPRIVTNRNSVLFDCRRLIHHILSKPLQEQIRSVDNNKPIHKYVYAL